jgi:hypothetical protein
MKVDILLLFKGVGSVWNYIVFRTSRKRMPTYSKSQGDATFFSDLFDKVLCMFRTGPLYTRSRYLSV